MIICGQLPASLLHDVLHTCIQGGCCHAQDMKGEWGQWLDEPTDKNAAGRFEYPSNKREVRQVHSSSQVLGRNTGTASGTYPAHEIVWTLKLIPFRLIVVCER